MSIKARIGQLNVRDNWFGYVLYLVLVFAIVASAITLVQVRSDIADKEAKILSLSGDLETLQMASGTDASAEMPIKATDVLEGALAKGKAVEASQMAYKDLSRDQLATHAEQLRSYFDAEDTNGSTIWMDSDKAYHIEFVPPYLFAGSKAPVMWLVKEDDTNRILRVVFGTYDGKKGVFSIDNISDTMYALKHSKSDGADKDKQFNDMVEQFKDVDTSVYGGNVSTEQQWNDIYEAREKMRQQHEQH